MGVCTGVCFDPRDPLPRGRTNGPGAERPEQAGGEQSERVAGRRGGERKAQRERAQSRRRAGGALGERARTCAARSLTAGCCMVVAPCPRATRRYQVTVKTTFFEDKTSLFSLNDQMDNLIPWCDNQINTVFPVSCLPSPIRPPAHRTAREPAAVFRQAHASLTRRVRTCPASLVPSWPRGGAGPEPVGLAVRDRELPHPGAGRVRRLEQRLEQRVAHRAGRRALQRPRQRARSHLVVASRLRARTRVCDRGDASSSFLPSCHLCTPRSQIVDYATINAQCIVEQKYIRGAMMRSLLYIQVSVSGQALVFVVRHQGWSIIQRAGTLTYVAFALAQTGATLIGIFGFGGYTVPRHKFEDCQFCGLSTGGKVRRRRRGRRDRESTASSEPSLFPPRAAVQASAFVVVVRALRPRRRPSSTRARCPRRRPSPSSPRPSSAARESRRRAIPALDRAALGAGSAIRTPSVFSSASLRSQGLRHRGLGLVHHLVRGPRPHQVGALLDPQRGRLPRPGARHVLLRLARTGPRPPEALSPLPAPTTRSRLHTTSTLLANRSPPGRRRPSARCSATRWTRRTR